MKKIICVMFIVIVFWAALDAEGQEINITDVRNNVFKIYKNIVRKGTLTCTEMYEAQELIEAYKTLTYMDPEATEAAKKNADHLVEAFTGTHSGKCKANIVQKLKSRYPGYFWNSFRHPAPGIKAGKEIPAYVFAQYFMSDKVREQYLNQLPPKFRQGSEIWQEENKKFSNYLELSKKQEIVAVQIEEMKDMINRYAPQIDKGKSKYDIDTSRMMQIMDAMQESIKLDRKNY